MQYRKYFIIKLKDPFDRPVDAFTPSLFILFTLSASQHCDSRGGPSVCVETLTGLVFSKTGRIQQKIITAL